MTSVLREIQQAPTYLVGGDVVHILTSSEETGGGATVVHVVCGPDSGPPPHVHANEDELFYVLEGEMTFLLGTKKVRGGPGTHVFARRGERHQFRNESDKVARFLVTIVPGGIDVFFREVGRGLPTGTMMPEPPTKAEIEAMIGACPRYGITLEL